MRSSLFREHFFFFIFIVVWFLNESSSDCDKMGSLFNFICIFLMTEDASSQIHECVHCYYGMYWLQCVCNNTESSDIY